MNDKIKIIIFDLETLPNLQEALKVWPSLSNFPGLTLKASISTILCFGFKELNGPVQIKSAWDFKGWKKNVNDDKELCAYAYSVLKDADCVVTQNGRSFDWKFLQTRLMINGLNPLPKIQHVDTKVMAKSNLYLFSNSMKHMASVLTDETKMENEGWDLWVKCYNKDKSAMKKMAEYCMQDVVTTEAMYKELRPFIKEQPSYSELKEEPVCANCGSVDLKSDGWRATTTRTYRRLMCKNCGTSLKLDLKDRVKRL